MANINGTVTRYRQHTVAFTYSNLTSANNIGNPIPEPFTDYADRSVQIDGTFNNATVLIEGSNDGTNYQTLTDPQGNAISKTAAALEQIMEQVLFLRPRTTGGGASQDIQVTIVARRGRGGVEV